MLLVVFISIFICVAYLQAEYWARANNEGIRWVQEPTGKVFTSIWWPHPKMFRDPSFWIYLTGLGLNYSKRKRHWLMSTNNCRRGIPVYVCTPVSCPHFNSVPFHTCHQDSSQRGKKNLKGIEYCIWDYMLAGSMVYNYKTTGYSLILNRER